MKDGTCSEVLQKMPDDKYWRSLTQTGRQKQHKNWWQYKGKSIFVVFPCTQPTQALWTSYHSCEMTGSWWQTRRNQHINISLSLSLIVLGQAFILFFSTVIFTVRRWGFSINNSFCFLSLLWFFYLCRNFAVSQGDSHFSSYPLHHTINLNVPRSNFLLHPVITVHHWGCSRSLYAGHYCSLSPSASLHSRATYYCLGFVPKLWFLPIISDNIYSLSLFLFSPVPLNKSPFPPCGAVSFASQCSSDLDPLIFFVCWAYYPHSLEVWNFLKFYQRRSAFSSNKHLCGYQRSQSGLHWCLGALLNFTEELRRFKQGFPPDTQFTLSQCTKDRAGRQTDQSVKVIGSFKSFRCVLTFT